MMSLRSLVGAGAAAVVAALLIPAVADGYWISVAISAGIYVLPVAGCGLLYGRLGMMTMFQVALLGVGTWVAMRFEFATGLPFVLVMLVAGVTTAVIGLAVSVPALRLSRLHFALLTLMAAGAAEVFFAVNGFPNGGTGFLGVRSALLAPKLMPRPSIAGSDIAFFHYVVAVVFVLVAISWWQMRGRSGRAWLLIRQGSAPAQSVGVNVARYTLWAVALSSFITGVGGALLAAQLGTNIASAFVPENSVIVFAVTLLGGSFSIGGYILGGVSAQAIPAAIQSLGANSNIGLVVFGVGLVATLLTAPEGAIGQLHDLFSGLSKRAGFPRSAHHRLEADPDA